jgi:hypothetical protein
MATAVVGTVGAAEETKTKTAYTETADAKTVNTEAV